MIIDSGSIQLETQKRLEVLYIKHNDWLMACAYNKSKNVQTAQDLVQELYLYLGEKNNPKLFYQDSFNLLYCHNFLCSRHINWVKREGRLSTISDRYDTEDEVYDEDKDIRLQEAYDKLKQELDRISKTKMWSAGKLFEMYSFAEITMEELSKKIGISKSTTFLNIKKIKEHLKEIIDNPFKDDKNDWN